MAKATVYIVGEAESFLAAVKQTVMGSTTMQREFSDLALSASKSAETQVKASALRISRIKEEISAVSALSASYKRGSTEQIAAMELVARKQRQLSSLTGTSFGAGGSNRRREEREASGVARGTLRGFGVGEAGLAALAGGTFFASFLGANALRSTISAATDAAAVERQLATAITKTGGSAEEELPRIKAWAEEQAKFGVSQDTALQGFARLLELTGSTRKAMEGYTAALQISKATGKDFNAVSLAVGKALDGQTTALARYIGKIPKGTSDNELLTRIMQKYGGQAAAATTQQERFSAELHNSEVIIGTALLPTVNHLLSSGAKWLDQMNRSGRLQHDVNTAVHDAGVVFGALSGIIRTVDGITGSFVHTLELLAGLKLASKLSGWETGISNVGSSAKTAEGEVLGLKGKLADLAAIGTIVIGIDIIERLIPKGKIDAKGQRILNNEGAGGLGNAPIIGRPARWGAALGRDLGNLLGINYGPAPGAVPSQYSASDLREAFLSGRENEAFPFSFTSKNFGAEWQAYAAGRKAGGDAIRKTVKGPVGDGSTTTPSTWQSGFALTARQKNTLALAANPNDVAAIKARIAYDDQAIAFAKKHIAEGKGSVALYKSLLSVESDRNGLESQLASMANKTAETAKKAAEAEARAAKKRLEAAQKIHDALEAERQKAQQLYQSAVQTAFSAIGQIGQGPVATGYAAQFIQQYGGHLNAPGYLADIRQQNRAFATETRDLALLRRRGAPKSLTSTLLAQGQAGADEAHALAHASRSVLRQFLDQYQVRQREVTKVARFEVGTMVVERMNMKVPSAQTIERNKFGRVPNSGRRRA
jgi:hypothetical protein